MRIGRTLAPAAAPMSWKDLLAGIAGLCRGQKELARFEDEIKTCFGVDSCILVSSGKAALTLVLQSLKALYPGRDEVLIPAYNCYSVPSAIVRAGLKVRLCDIDPETLDFDFEQLTPKLKSERLLCVLPTHMFGRPADIERLRSLIQDPEITIVEDAAQALGGEGSGRKLGTLGDVGIFSLGRGKALSTVEGGIVLCNRAEIARDIEKRAQSLPPYSGFEKQTLLGYAIALVGLLHPRVFWLPKSLPFLKLGETIFDPDFRIRRMSPLQAGFARGWEGRLEMFQRARRATATQWKTALGKEGADNNAAKAPDEATDWIRFPWRIDSIPLRTKVLEHSERKGLGIAATYPSSIDGIVELRKDFEGEHFPAARALAEKLVTLPVHPLLGPKDVADIRQIIFEATNHD